MQDVRGFAEDTLYPPLGIIAGAFELNKKSWLDRNVYGKLVAMSMALSKKIGTATPQSTNQRFSKQIFCSLHFCKACPFGQGNVAQYLQCAWDTDSRHKQMEVSLGERTKRMEAAHDACKKVVVV